jgi:hypothetical protein
MKHKPATGTWRVFPAMTLMLLFVILLNSCRNETDGKQQSITIHGQITNCAGQKVLLEEMDINAVHPLDSANLNASGSFGFTVKTDQTGFYLLRIPGKKRILLLLNPNEKLEIKGDCNQATEEITFQGSPGTIQLAEFLRETKSNSRKIDSIKAILHGKEGTPEFMKLSMDADEQFRQITDTQRRTELDFLKKYPNSLACLIVLNYSFGPQPILDIDHDFAFYAAVDSNLQLCFPGNKHLVYHHQRILEKRRQESLKELQGKPGK